MQREKVFTYIYLGPGGDQATCGTCFDRGRQHTMSPCVCALLQQGSTSTAVRQQPGPQHHSGNRAAPCRAVSLRLTPQWLGRRSVASRAQCRTVQAAATAEMGKLIAKTEIPAFIPRQDLMDQLTRWAYTEIQEESMRKFGLAVKASVKSG